MSKRNINTGYRIVIEVDMMEEVNVGSFVEKYNIDTGMAIDE